MELRLIIMAVICLCIAQMAFATEGSYDFATREEEQRFINLTKHLRCAECQNQTLFDSNASLAIDMRTQIYTMLSAGATDDTICDYLSYRYGDYILFKPPFRLNTAALWLGPLLMLLVAISCIWRFNYAS